MTGLSIEQTREIVDDFLAHYNGNIKVEPRVCERQEDIYGQANTAERFGAFEGAYHPGKHIVTLIASNLDNVETARRTLRHELLGHYGLNTFKPDEKRALLDSVLETRQEPTLRHIWEKVENDKHYSNLSDLQKAEEVFAFVAEEDRTFFQKGWDRVRSVLQDVLRTAGLSDRPLTIFELYDEARQIAKGIREGTRKQQTFPLSDDAQFRIKESKRMAKRINPKQMSLFGDWLVTETIKPPDKPRYILAQCLAEKLNKEGEISSRFLTSEANRIFGGTQAEGAYTSKDAYDAMEAAFNIHLTTTERTDWNNQGADWAGKKAQELTDRVLKLPTQSRRDEEMEEFQQFSTPPAVSFVANWVANIRSTDVMMEPSAGTGDLAIWSKIAGAEVVLNELSPRRQELLGDLFPDATLYKENAEQLDNVLPSDVVPSVIVMNPPFSSSAGRVQGQRDTSNGARHIEQALKRLQDGGRLVAIVGQGMAADRPAFSKWWQDVEVKYNVRANVGLSGMAFAKYGTTFDNQILIIDKTGPTNHPILTSNVESVAELPILLEGIRNERQHIQQSINKPTVNEDPQAVSDTIRPINGSSGIGSDKRGVRAQSIGNGGDRGTSLTDSKTSSEPTTGHVTDDGSGAGSRVQNGAVREIGGSGGGVVGGNSGVDKGKNAANVVVETTTAEKSEFSDSVFSNYTPQRLTIPGAKQHPGKLVQAAAMSAVEPPAPTYSPLLPENLIHDGLLSIAQLEAVVYAGQAHSDLLPNGARKGFFIGDGTGVGKGREISGIILDNMMQGRKKAVWVSFNNGLLEDAKRDFSGVGGDSGQIFFQGKTKAGGEILQKEGILFTTYSTLRGGEKRQATDEGQKEGKSRSQQIIEWLGKDFDGVIAFDEAHSMGNAIAIKGKRGTKKPSQQALAGINLQHELPNARIVYVSATGATEISNLRYTDRLGLWGEGTPFADANTFIDNVSRGGIAAMELISRDMKAMGMSISRSLSYDGVSYERKEHTLSDLQEDIYNELAGAWQIVLNNVEQALEITQAGHNGNAKSAAYSQFWGAHQRFFNQIITAMQTPSVIDDIRLQLDAGNAAVIQLVNTNEAAQERIIADATANNAALEDLDFTPRQMLIDYVRHGFPVAAFQESSDDSGNVVYVPVRDSEGNQVFDREAIALRDSLLETLHEIRVPENPLDSIINAFGSDRVAEVTGRSRRFVQTRDDEGNLKIVEEKRGKNSSMNDAEAFQNNKKDILIFSGAGGTGYSFHADNSAANQRKRIHYILQPGWQADKAVQGFGRTHRTNQAQVPHYVLPTTNLKAQKRFVSSIARRLDQLGALTRGQREATSQGIFTASDNLESIYATSALRNLFIDMYRDRTPLVFNDVTKQMGLRLLDENGTLNEGSIPAIPQFLNRLLSLKTDMQNAVFNQFETRLVEAVEYAKQNGLYDTGLQTLKALSIKKTRDSVVYEDSKTGAQTRYVELAVTNKIEYRDWENAKKLSGDRQRTDDLSGWFVSEYGNNKGEVFYLRDIGERIDPEGNLVRRGCIYPIRKTDHKYTDDVEDISRDHAYKNVGGRFQKVTVSREITEAEAENLWKEQITNAPKTITKTEGMIVGVILPIWDRVEGSEVIKRLQTDDGEQLLGRMLGPKASKQTLKNLGMDSGLSNMSASDLLHSIKNGNKAILSNGWEISTSKVNFEDRIEIKGRSSLTDAEKRLLKEQGAFIERISWSERAFIPTGDRGIATFERITASKPVVELIEKNRVNNIDTFEQGYGIPEISAGQAFEKNIADETAQQIIGEVISMKNNIKPKAAFHEKVAEKLIEQLKAGTAPWQKPWEPGEPNAYLPINPTTGKRYKGINVLNLIAQERSDARWMTYRQAESVGAQVRKGEKSTSVQYWKFSEEQNKLDDYGKPILDDKGEPVKETVLLERPRAFFSAVFNAQQIDGLPLLQPRKEQEWDPVERAENILQASGAVIRHAEMNRAFYRPATDSIHLPEKGQFPNSSNYYATALHELGHWTGHESRLARDLVHPFGSEGYAKEELRAEIASMILGDELGIGHDPGQHASYVGSWIKALQDDPQEIFRAAAAAEKIQDYVLAFEQKQILTLNQEKTHEETAYQKELDRLMELSTLTPRVYVPTESGKNSNHAAVFINDFPAILCGPANDPQSIALAKALAESDHVGNAFKAAGRPGDIHSGIMVGRNIQWNENESSIVVRPSSQVERRENGPLVAIVLNDPEQVLTTSLCITTETARIFDPKAPELDDGNTLAAIANAQQIAPHLLTSDAFALVATALPLENHGRKWEVFVGDKSLGFADADTADAAVRDMHHNMVNNALYSRSSENTGSLPVQEMPPGNVLAEYTDLKTKFADIEDFQKQGQTMEHSQAPKSDIKESQAEKTYLTVSFIEKEDVKELGAKWDRQQKAWYIPEGIDPAPLQKWAKTTADVPKQSQPERQYLAVPYGERMAAKAAGAEWDKTAKSWYAGPKADMAKLERWNPENVPNQQGPAMSPQEEFAQALRSVGCIVDGEHPIMDGTKQRIRTEGEKQGEKSGFYVGHVDGHPAGYVKNNRTGVEMKWKSKGYALDPEQKAQIQAETAEKLQARKAEQIKTQEAAAERVGRQMADLVPVEQPTAYMLAKGIEPKPGVFTDKEGKNTFVPAMDVNGKLWSMQYINEDGTKRFAKDSHKEGCFHVVGGMDALTKAPALVIGEGYATASSLSASLGYATIAAFDSGNLPSVANALHQKFPDKPIIVAGDNDKHLEESQGINPGKIKAQEAARLTGGKVLLPIFAPGEEKGFTDFNDLANKSALGKNAIDRQVVNFVSSVVEQKVNLDRVQQQETQQQEKQQRRGAKM